MRVRVQVDEYREFGLVTRGEHAGGELVFARLLLLFFGSHQLFTNKCGAPKSKTDIYLANEFWLRFWGWIDLDEIFRLALNRLHRV